jgi:hypothetical protein
MRRRFLEMDGNHIGAILFVYHAFRHVRRIVGSGVELERSQHFSISFLSPLNFSFITVEAAALSRPSAGAHDP